MRSSPRGRTFEAVLCFVAAFATLSALNSEPQAGEIRIEVKDASGAPVQASGVLSGRNGAVVRTFATDAHGRSALINLPYGMYDVRISKPGFADERLEIDVQSPAVLSRTVTLTIQGKVSKVTVVASTPLGGTDVSVEQLPEPIQTVDAREAQQSGAIDPGDLMNRRLNGVYLNEMQSNPFQPDVNFRGYTASPLLGTPEGISVFVDGVRQNQPFGDVVSWDLIPENAIAEVTLIPGSNPIFGLNTLGGALSITTKDGVSAPGFDGSVLYGASNRKQLEAAYGGGKAVGLNWFVAGNYFHESGWRYDSPSTVRQAFGRVGWRTAKADLGLTYSYGDNTLYGNGLQDYRVLAADPRSVYSVGDVTANHSPSVNLIARYALSSAWNLAGDAWYRHIGTSAVNPNINTDSLDESVYQPNASEIATLTAAGYKGFPTSGANAQNTPFPKWRCIAQALVNGDTDERCDGIDIFSGEAQNDYGFSGQASWTSSPAIGRNRFTAGISLDRGSVTFTQSAQYGYLNPDRTLTVVPAFQDGTATVNPVDSRVHLHGRTPSWSAYFTDTLTLAKTVNVTVSGRFNRLAVHNFDYLTPAAGPGSLNGDYIFQRFNPAVGVTWSPASYLTVYGNYTESSRAPTAIELGCSDPANPCSLPNALSSDPPLAQVASRTWEAGVRGAHESSLVQNLRWNAGAFRGDNRNDILFVNSVQLGTGYFQNFARTRREGFDANLSGRIRRVTWGLDYTFLLATYQSPAVVDGAGNNTSDTALAGYPGLDGNIYIRPGDRIPLIPKHTGKAFADIQATSKLGFDVTEAAVSSSYARGNENNAYKADGVYYQGPGVSPGYGVTDIVARYDLSKRVQLALRVDNLFNLRYYTGAQIANTGLTAQGTFLARPYPAYTKGPEAGQYPLQSVTFFAPGAPRREWVELRIKF